MGKRILALTEIFAAALGGFDALSPVKQLRVEEAGQLKALAEFARGEFMRDGKGCLDDIVRIERKASLAEKALGVVEPKAKASAGSLVDHFSRPPSHERLP